MPELERSLPAPYQPPLNWSVLLTFLDHRTTPKEWIADDAYHRIVNGHEVSVRNDVIASRLVVTIPAALVDQTDFIMNRVRRVFDLDANPAIIAAALSHDKLMARLLDQFPGIRIPGAWDPFEVALRTIIGQQVSVAGASTIMRRLIERIGVTPERIAVSSPETIAAIGMPGRRGVTIWTLGAMVASGDLRLDESDPKRFYDQLITIPGIGPWTAENLLMRLLGYPDAFLAGDLGIQKAVRPGQRMTEKQLREYSTIWRPWRSYATLLLANSLARATG